MTESNTPQEPDEIPTDELPSDTSGTTEPVDSGAAASPLQPPAGATEPDPAISDEEVLPPPPIGHAPTVPRRIYRSRSDRKIGGVAAGLAQYLNLDPTIVRIAFVVLTLTGASILLYIAAWILVPERPEHEPEPVWQGINPSQDRHRAIAMTLAGVGITIAILNESWLVLALVLIGGGLWLLAEKPALGDLSGASAKTWTAPPGAGTATAEPVYAMAGAAPAAAPVAPTTPATPYPPASAYRSPPSGWAWEPTIAATESGPHVPPAPTKRPPQRITWIVLSLLALLAAIGIAAATGNWWDVSGSRMLGIALVTIGSGVVLGTLRRGGARGLVPLGIFTALLLIPVSAVDGLVDDGVGENVYRPVTISELQTEYRHGVGEITLDLSALDFEGTSAAVEVDLGMGEVKIVLPDDVGGSLDLESNAGEIIIDFPGSRNDLRAEGINERSGLYTLPGDSGTLTLDVEVGFGVINVEGN